MVTLRKSSIGLSGFEKLTLLVEVSKISNFKKHEKYIKNETLATQLNLTATEQRFSFEIDEHEFSLSIEKDSS